jgi:ATP-dependent helicase/nuclease subunit A
VKIHVVSASAGTGKTHRLAEEMAQAVLDGSVRPEGIVAVTFTNKAAAELARRLRERLLAHGRTAEAARIRDGWLGTLHSLGQRLITELAFEAGLSPFPTPSPEVLGKALFRAAVDDVVGEGVGDVETLARSLSLATRDDQDRAGWDRALSWRDVLEKAVRKAVENRLPASVLADAADASMAELLTLLDPVDATVVATDQSVVVAIAALEKMLRIRVDDARAKKGAAPKSDEERLAFVRGIADRLGRDQPLTWGELAKFTKDGWSTGFLAQHVAPIRDAAARHLAHPRLHDELRRILGEVFARSADVQGAFLDRKAKERLIDFEDMLGVAADLVRKPEVRERLAGRFDLVLVDEFQDTSPVQLELVLGLAALAPRTLWVGDRKQAIYGFQGSDPALMAQATSSVLGDTGPEVLGRSYRSRPPLVRFCSELFARAFAPHGFAANEVAVEPACPEPEPLVGAPALRLWRLGPAPGEKKVDVATAIAHGVAELLASPPLVRERVGRPDQVTPTRPATTGDVAVLARTNVECGKIAAALRGLGISARVALMGLGEQPETWWLRAGLALLVDGRDRLAAAELAWLGGAHASDPDAWLAARVAANASPELRDVDLADDPSVAAVRGLASRAVALSPVEAVDAVLAALDAPRRVLAWPDPERGLSNLEALRVVARAYEEACTTRRVAATVAGLVAHLEALPNEAPQAVSGDADAVTVMTWHKAKGLEWPIVVLTSLDHDPDVDPYELRVRAAEVFDAERPLAGRALRWWPNPYGGQKQKMVLTERAAQASSARLQSSREEDVRLLYVAFTRARDHLVLAAGARKDSTDTSRLDRLVDVAGVSLLDLPWLTEGAAEIGVEGVEARWPCTVHYVHDHVPDALVRSPEAARWFEAGERTSRAARDASPSSAVLEPAVRDAVRVTEVVRLRDRERVDVASGRFDAVGDAIHGFLGADPGPTGDGAARLALAERLVHAHDLGGSLDPRGLVGMGDALDAWLTTKAPGQPRLREWPVVHLREDGRLVRGAVDLLVPLDGGGWLLVDHKSFPGDASTRDERARGYAGQLGAYAAAIEAATGERVREMWVHMAVRGECVRLVPAPSVGFQSSNPILRTT